MNTHKRIFIIGHSGAGKALFAKYLAEKLGWQFIDADFGLEFRIGRNLTEILDEQGKKAFLNCQLEILTKMNQENSVITTDASIVCSKKNRQFLSDEFVVHLKVSIPIQLERTLRHPEQLLSGRDLKLFLGELHSERDSLYEQVSKLSIDSDDSALEEHILRVVDALSDPQVKTMTHQITLDRRDWVIFHKELYVPVHLTQQQAQSLKLLSQGKSSKEIANDLHISYRTVEGVIAKLMQLLGCTSSKELITLYLSQP